MQRARPCTGIGSYSVGKLVAYMSAGSWLLHDHSTINTDLAYICFAGGAPSFQSHTHLFQSCQTANPTKQPRTLVSSLTRSVQGKSSTLSIDCTIPGGLVTITSHNFLLTNFNRVQVDIDLPQIIIAGSQSSGKSSLMEAVCGVPFPRNSGTCTRYLTNSLSSNN